MSAEPEALIDDARTLPELFRKRVRRSPESTAYRFYDALNDVWMDYSWTAMKREAARWQTALRQEKLRAGDRVAIMAPNSRFWVMFDQASLGLGLVNVPLFAEDRVDNVEYILQETGAKLLVIGGTAQWERLQSGSHKLRSLKRIVSIGTLRDEKDPRLVSLPNWLADGNHEFSDEEPDENNLATIVYTSGTSGRPKGVMLSHKNILSNAVAGIRAVTIDGDQLFLSFLPLSHMLERTVGYYLPMMAGATVAHARSIPNLADDLRVIRPTVIISVPRIYERMYARIQDQLQAAPAFRRRLFFLAAGVGWKYFNYRQGRAGFHPAFLLWPLLKRLVAERIAERLGGRLRIAISGGASLAPEIARAFVGLGVPVLQGYGLTEASPVISVNRLDNNIPTSVGPPLPGVEVRLDEDGELLVRGDNIMLGYWNNKHATMQTIGSDGWLHTGDRARFEDHHIYLTGRIKDIIVLSTGEKVPPADMELAIATDPLFEQIMIIGESRPYLTALVALNSGKTDNHAEKETDSCEQDSQENTEAWLLERINRQLKNFPGYAEVHRVTAVNGNWTVENGLLTPTMKMKREAIMEKHAREIERMYEGHTVT